MSIKLSDTLHRFHLSTELSGLSGTIATLAAVFARFLHGATLSFYLALAGAILLGNVFWRPRFTKGD